MHSRKGVLAAPLATACLAAGAQALAMRSTAVQAAEAPTAGFVDAWLATSDAAKESQPHWISPLVTVTPRLEQEFRYDQSWQARPRSVDLDSYGGGKGLEIIPTPDTELILGVPAYQTRTTPKGRVTGWADETLLLKGRFIAANEEHGNYIVTGFLGVALPTGNSAFTNRDVIVTPTLGAGKGWGTREAGFDVQTTLGIALPTSNLAEHGRPITWNTAFQAHLLGKLWPELEVNYTHYDHGPNDGRNQVALTAGAIVGRFELSHRARLIFGGGFQQAVSSFRTFQHTWLMSGRVIF